MSLDKKSVLDWYESADDEAKAKLRPEWKETLEQQLFYRKMERDPEFSKAVKKIIADALLKAFRKEADK